MRLLIAATIAVGCLASISPPHAQEDPRTPEEVERVFDSIDRNNDDRISKREGQRAEVIRDRFAGIDSDEDGYLTRAEYRARPRDEGFE